MSASPIVAVSGCGERIRCKTLPNGHEGKLTCSTRSDLTFGVPNASICDPQPSTKLRFGRISH